MKQNPVHKKHRIHTQQSKSGLWLACIVNLGKEKVETKNSLTDSVTRIPREYDSEEEAIQAAKDYIDQEATHEQEN